MATPGRARVKWHGDKQFAGMKRELYRGLRKAAAAGRALVVEAISKPARAGGGGRRRPAFGYKKIKGSERMRGKFTRTGELGRGMRWRRGKGGSEPEFFKRRAAGKPMQFNRSKPGQPPKRDTGKLARSIFWSGDRQRLMVVVGTKVKYGVSLEKGAYIPARRPKRKKVMVFGYKGKWVYTMKAKGFRLKKRPYLWRTLKRNRRRLKRLILSEAKAFSAKGGIKIG